MNMSRTKVSMTPCYKCEERRVDHEYNCHAVCERYQAFYKERREGDKQALTIAKVNEIIFADRVKGWGT